MWVNIAVTPEGIRQRHEAPTPRQAARMAAYRRDLLAKAQAIVESDPARAFEFDCEAWDVERDLRDYGFGNLI